MGQLVSTASPTGDELRLRAKKCSDELSNLHQQIRVSQNSRDFKKVTELRTKVDEKHKERDLLNAKAAAEIFAAHNPSYPDLGDSWRNTITRLWSGKNMMDGLKKIDLHGLFVKEAKQKMEEHLEACRIWKVKNTWIITGRGKNSVGGVAKIRPEVEEWLKTHGPGMGIRIMDASNPGAFQLELTGEKTILGSLWAMLGY
jgi:DNA-nicking Smr family endonuclease